MRKGMKIEVIEEYPSDSEIGHVDKVRIFGRGTSVVGYTIFVKGQWTPQPEAGGKPND